MAVAVVATAGAANANSYASLAEATAYFATRLNAAAWTDEQDSDQQARALIEASRALTLLEGQWEGQRMTIAQALSWPRQFAINPDAPEIIGIHDIALLYFATDIVPQRVKDATCELALAFLAAGTTDLTALDPKLAIHRKRLDVLETEFVHPQLRAQGLARFPRVLTLISPLFNAGVGGGLMLVRS